MDVERIEELLRTRPPRERTYDRHLPALIETTRSLEATVRVRGGSPVGLSARALGFALVVIAAVALVGTWQNWRGGFATSPGQSPGTFASTGSMSHARVAGTATLLTDGRVLMAGGFVPAGGVFSTAELYDPKTGTFSATGSMIVARYEHTATRLADGRVLIAGGMDGTKDLATAEIYDPATGAFSLTGSMVKARASQTATLLADGRVLVAGGNHPDIKTDVPTASAELYDPKTGTFSATGSMAVARINTTATLLPDGMVLIAGGSDGTVDKGLKSAELYDPATGTFGATGPLTIDRASATTTLLLDGRVLVAGGYGTQGQFSSAELYDPETGIFSPTGSMARPREGHSATRLADGRVLILGAGEVNGAAELYDPTTGTFKAAGSLPYAQTGAMTTLLLDGRVLIVGGAGFAEGQFVSFASAVLYRP